MGALLCSNCGRNFEEGSSYCTYCGQDIIRPHPKIYDSDLKSLIDKLARMIAARDHSDRRISIYWIAVPLVVLIISAMITTAVVFSEAFSKLEDWGQTDEVPDFDYFYDSPEVAASQLIALVAYAMMAKLSYDLIERNNRHFTRENGLREAVTSFVVKSTGRSYGLFLPTDAERKRAPFLWPLFIIIPPSLNFGVLCQISHSDDPARHLG